MRRGGLVPLIARLTNPLAWRSPRRNIRRLLLFARAETHTLIELEQAANLSPDPGRASAYLIHAADEVRHARMFVGHARRLAQEHGLPAVSAPRTDTTHLFQTLGEVVFLAFMHQGETRGQQQFTTYRDHLRSTDPKGSAMFDAILMDEARHASYTRTLLEELAPARAALGKAWRWEAWRTVRIMQRSTASTLFIGAFLLMVPLLALVSLWTRWVRPSELGWR